MTHSDPDAKVTPPSGLSLHSGYAHFDSDAFIEWTRKSLLTTEKELMLKEEKLLRQKQVLESIAARTEPLPLPRLWNGKFTSIKKANVMLQEVRNNLSYVSKQKEFTQRTLQRLR
ncbi:MAG: hypothetical protein NTX79_03295 [Candidatus Micrarchaeota archaeon]|nr:hypothetical protein [Candidatus Micrarchaeota archaeon]